MYCKIINRKYIASHWRNNPFERIEACVRNSTTGEHADELTVEVRMLIVPG